MTEKEYTDALRVVMNDVKTFKSKSKKVFEECLDGAIKKAMFQGFWLGSITTGTAIVLVVWLAERYLK